MPPALCTRPPIRAPVVPSSARSDLSIAIGRKIDPKLRQERHVDHGSKTHAAGIGPRPAHLPLVPPRPPVIHLDSNPDPPVFFPPSYSSFVAVQGCAVRVFSELRAVELSIRRGEFIEKHPFFLFVQRPPLFRGSYSS